MAEHRLQRCEHATGNNLLIEGLADAAGFVGMVLVGMSGGEWPEARAQLLYLLDRPRS